MRTIGTAEGGFDVQDLGMKTQTKQRYIERVERAAHLLAERLADPPSADELARAVGVSRFHFQRIYRAATGETLLDTLRRLRALKALELLDADATVTEVAGAVGYDTPQAFARAFRQSTGVTPSEARGRSRELAPKLRRPDMPGAAPVEIEVASLEPMRLVTLRTRRPFGPLNDVYESLFEAIAAQDKLAAVSGLYGLPENDPCSEPGGIEAHIAGVGLGDRMLDGFEPLEIEAGPALRSRHVGPFDGIDSTALEMYRHVVERGLELADRPALHHHLDDPDEVPSEQLRTDLYLALDHAPRGDSA